MSYVSDRVGYLDEQEQRGRGGRTKIRMIQVSRRVRYGGRMEKRDIVAGCRSRLQGFTREHTASGGRQDVAMAQK